MGGFRTTGIHQLNRDAKVTDKFLEPNLGFTPHKRYGLLCGVFSSSDISNIMESNTHPNSLVVAGIKQTTSEMVVKNKHVKPENKVLASSDFSNTKQECIWHRNVQCKFCYSHSDCPLMWIALLVASAQCFICGTEAVLTFKPCGHAVICAGCAQRVKKCPTCKVLYMYAHRPVLHDYMFTCTSHCSTLETSQEF